MTSGPTGIAPALASKSEQRLYREQTNPIIAAAIEVHRHHGPGLLGETYELCLCHELHLRGLRFRTQVHLPILYKGIRLAAAYRVDLIVNDFVIVELKAVEQILPIHEAQLLTYSGTPANESDC